MATAQTGVEPFEEQEPFLWDRHTYYNYAAGVGSGKTAVGVIRDALNAELWNPGKMGAIVAPTTRMVKTSIFPIMEEFGLRQRWDYHGPSAEEPGFHTPQGSRIVVLSADNERNVERAAGLNLAWWHIDEARDVPERMFEILQQRLRKGEYLNGYTTSTPRKNHYEEWCFRDLDRDDATQYGGATVYDGDDRLTITGVTPDCNPHVPDDYQSRLLGDLPEEIAAQEVQGEFVDIGGGVYQREMFDWVHPEKDIKDSYETETVIGVDPAATTDSKRAESQDSDYWGVVVADVHLTQNTIYVVDSHQRRGMTLHDGVEWLRAIMDKAGRRSAFIVEINQSQRWLRDELRDAGLNVSGVNTTRNKENKLIDMSIPISNGTVKWVDWSATDDDIQSKPFEELRGQLLSFPDGSHDDLADALSLIVNHGPIDTTTSISVDSREERDLWG